jgi:hypothetical protein
MFLLALRQQVIRMDIWCLFVTFWHKGNGVEIRL